MENAGTRTTEDWVVKAPEHVESRGSAALRHGVARLINPFVGKLEWLG